VTVIFFDSSELTKRYNKVTEHSMCQCLPFYLMAFFYDSSEWLYDGSYVVITFLTKQETQRWVFIQMLISGEPSFKL
jgi:hypothetical protein